MAKPKARSTVTTLFAVSALVALSAGGGMAARPVVSDALAERASSQPVTPEAVAFPEPLILNLAGDGGNSYVKIGVAVQLEKMTEQEHEALSASLAYGEKGGHGKHGGEAATLERLGRDPMLHDAVIGVVTRYTAKQMLNVKAREQLRQALAVAMNAAEQQRAGKPRFQVRAVLFTEFAVQRAAR